MPCDDERRWFNHFGLLILADALAGFIVAVVADRVQSTVPKLRLLEPNQHEPVYFRHVYFRLNQLLISWLCLTLAESFLHFDVQFGEKCEVARHHYCQRVSVRIAVFYRLKRVFD